MENEANEAKLQETEEEALRREGEQIGKMMEGSDKEQYKAIIEGEEKEDSEEEEVEEIDERDELKPGDMTRLHQIKKMLVKIAVET